MITHELSRYEESKIKDETRRAEARNMISQRSEERLQALPGITPRKILWRMSH